LLPVSRFSPSCFMKGPNSWMSDFHETNGPHFGRKFHGLVRAVS
jgi:hypothetical protein